MVVSIAKRIGFLGWIVAIGFCLGFFPLRQAAAQPEESQPPPPLAQLEIQGKFIKKLVLQNEKNESVPFENPGEIIELPAGKYRIINVITNGYNSYSALWIEVESNKENVLKVGGPLYQYVTAIRQGKILRLDYSLRGQGGESYTSLMRNKPPQFAVFQGDKQIAAGAFEYG